MRSSFAGRCAVPALVSAAVFLFARIGNRTVAWFHPLWLSRWLASIFGTIEFASVVFGALAVYPVAYFRGAKPAERVAAGSLSLVLWILIDSYQVSAAFPWLEVLYYGINIGAVLLAWNFAQMSLVEIACRRVERSRGRQVRMLTPLPLLALLVFLGVVCLLSREGGEYYFNLLLDGYLAIFRN